MRQTLVHNEQCIHKQNFVHAMELKRIHLHKTCPYKYINKNLAVENAFQNVDIFWLPRIKLIKHLQKEKRT
jgi:hypothetical protein